MIVPPEDHLPLGKQVAIVDRINDRGFGFLKLEASEKEAFFHARDILGGVEIREFQKGEKVNCIIRKSERFAGGLDAFEIERIHKPKQRSRRARSRSRSPRKRNYEPPSKRRIYTRSFNALRRGHAGRYDDRRKEAGNEYDHRREGSSRFNESRRDDVGRYDERRNDRVQDHSGRTYRFEGELEYSRTEEYKSYQDDDWNSTYQQTMEERQSSSPIFADSDSIWPEVNNSPTRGDNSWEEKSAETVSMNESGHIDRLNPNGFGFIKTSFGDELYFHAKECRVDFGQFQAGDRVEYIRTKSELKEGHEEAIGVQWFRYDD